LKSASTTGMGMPWVRNPAEQREHLVSLNHGGAAGGRF
jgi:hypothetical protein